MTEQTANTVEKQTAETEIVQQTETKKAKPKTEKKADYAIRYKKGATADEKLSILTTRIAALQKEKRRQQRAEAKAAAQAAERARTHRKCVLAGTVEMVERREIPLEDNDRMDTFENYYRNVLRQAAIGNLVETAAGRKVTDFEAFRKFIDFQVKNGYFRG